MAQIRLTIKYKVMRYGTTNNGSWKQKQSARRTKPSTLRPGFIILLCYLNNKGEETSRKYAGYGDGNSQPSSPQTGERNLTPFASKRQANKGIKNLKAEERASAKKVLQPT